MKKVLFISYAFPPTGGVGVLRSIKFIKYLNQFGWDVSVLTAKNGFSRIKDNSLLEEIPSGTKVYRAGYNDPLLWFANRWWQSFLQYLVYRWFLFPDRESLWQEAAFQEAEKIIKENGIDLVFTSSAALSNHFIAYKLKEKLKIKWVADFRDEWVSNPDFHFPTFFHKKKAEAWQKELLEMADRVVTVSEPMTEYFQKLIPKPDKISTITNGFDPDDFPVSNYKRSDICRMLYVGTVYGSGKQNFFGQAVQELNLPDLKFEYISQNNYLPHKEAILKMQEVDVLVQITGPKPRPALYSGKLFEYLAARRPILALSASGTMMEKVIKTLGVGEVVHPLDKEGIKKTILNFYKKWQKNELNVPDVDINHFSRKFLAQNLAKIFEDLVEPKKYRVCLTVNTKSPQNEELTRYLLDRGHEVHFVSLDETGVEGAVNYHIRQDKLVNKFTPLYLLKGFLNKRRALLELKRLIQTIKPDIVHGHGINFAGILAFNSEFKPVVVTTRGSDIMKIKDKPWLERYLIKETLKESDIVTGSSLALKRQALNLGTPEKNWRDVFFGIDLEVFKKKDAGNLKEKLKIKSEKIIFCPRTIAPIYNTDVLIEAVAGLKEKNWKLILLTYRAESQYLAKIKQMIKSFGVEDNIIWLESAKPEEMAELDSLADVVVSLAQSDGAAVSFLEAMACEAKIVISDVEFVKEWVDGDFWVVPIGDAEETKKALEEALSVSQEVFKVKGKKNRELIAKRAEINSNFCKFEKIYQELVN